MTGGPGGLDRAAWVALDLVVPEARVETVLGLVGPPGLGVEQLTSRGPRCRIRAYFADVATAADCARRVSCLPEGGGAVQVRLRAVRDGRWVERQQRSVRPFPLGRRFVVCPGAGVQAAASGRMRLVLVPGRAFGTGEHATTRLEVEELERSVVEGSRWLDLGCGSGILSVVAARAGAALVLALDIDPHAVAVAAEVLAANGVTRRAALALGGPAAARPGGWDGVAANVESGFFAREASRLAALLAPGGVVLSSGFGPADEGEVDRALLGAGLRPVARRERDGWCLLVHRAAARGDA